MSPEVIVTAGYFDGTRAHLAGPYTIALRDGCIESVQAGCVLPPGTRSREAGFVLPGLVDSHVHLFLDGAERRPERRQAHLATPRETLLAAGRRALADSLRAGVTQVRDAGDIHGVNLQLRAEAAASRMPWPGLSCAGAALRARARYGSFMAREVDGEQSIEALVAALAPQADEIKVLLTGIIDFDAGAVKGTPQFSLGEATRLVRAARAAGRRTFVHCSGAEGIEIALKAGFDSIEHGFFVTRGQLERMARQQVCWVPTFAPVHFQCAEPAWAGWGAQAQSNLRRILDEHAASLREAYRLGVPVQVGSDAGGHGVPHGCGCVREIELMVEAGVPLAQVLRSATSLPRQVRGLPSADIRPGARAELVLLEASPWQELTALHRVAAVYRGAWHESGPTPTPVCD